MNKSHKLYILPLYSLTQSASVARPHENIQHR